MNKFRIEFTADDVDCEIEIGANGYEDVKERFFDLLRAHQFNGMLYKTTELSEVQAAEEFIKRGKVTHKDIKRTLKIDS